MQTNKQSALIIGAGVSGLASAYFLNKAGFQVSVFDKTEATDNCSFGNAGFIAPRYITPLASPGIINEGLVYMLKKESPFYIKPRLNLDLIKWGLKFKKAATKERVEAAGPVLRDMIQRNQQILENLVEQEKLDFLYQKHGHLTICETQESLDKEKSAIKRANELGIEARILSAEEAFEKEPYLPKSIIGAAHYPGDSHLSPGKLMTELRAYLEKEGVQFILNAEVSQLVEENNKIELTTVQNQKYKADVAVICAGVWTQDLGKKINVNLPTQAGKGYSITLKNPPAMFHHNFTMADRKVAVTPIGSDTMRFSGTMEIVGKDTSITKPKVNAIKRAVLEFYPQYTMEDLDEEEVWVGLRPCSADGMPYVGRLKGYSNLYVSSGFAMVGMSMSFASAEIIQQLITEGKAELDNRLIDPNRFD